VKPWEKYFGLPPVGREGSTRPRKVDPVNIARGPTVEDGHIPHPASLRYLRHRRRTRRDTDDRLRELRRQPWRQIVPHAIDDPDLSVRDFPMQIVRRGDADQGIVALPWIIAVGATIRESSGVRSPYAPIAPICRATPAGRQARRTDFRPDQCQDFRRRGGLSANCCAFRKLSRIRRCQELCRAGDVVRSPVRLGRRRAARIALSTRL